MRDRTSIQRKVARGVLLLAAASAACGDGGGDGGAGGSTGTLVVPFELGNKRSCEDVGVEYVRAELDDEAFVQEAPCVNGQVRFKDIPAGTYRIKISAFDDKDVEVMDSYDNDDDVVNVTGGDLTDKHERAVMLTSAPAHLLVRWTFGFSSCRGTGIDTFDIQVWHSGGDDLLLSDTLPCTLEGSGKDQYREIDDPERRLSGEQSGEVTIQAYDKTGVEVGPAAAFKYRAPGPGHSIRLSIDCDQGACTGSGRPDPDD